MQSALSKWRAANGGAAINASGNLDQDTKDAIIGFQRQSGLHPHDGAFSPALANRLSVMLKILEHYPSFVGDLKLEKLTGGAGFGSMDQQTQVATLARIQADVQGAGTLDRIRLIERLIKEPGFEQLPTKSQKLLLETLAARPDDADLTGNLDQLVASSAFRKLDENVREVVLRHSKAYGGDRQRIDNTENAITATAFFDIITEQVQKQLIRKVSSARMTRSSSMSCSEPWTVT